jgi:hypothetical protein
VYSKTIILLIVCLRPEMRSTAMNSMPQEASDFPYDFKKILESCPQVASLPLLQPHLSGIITVPAFLANMCIVSDQAS